MEIPRRARSTLRVQRVLTNPSSLSITTTQLPWAWVLSRSHKARCFLRAEDLCEVTGRGLLLHANFTSSRIFLHVFHCLMLTWFPLPPQPVVGALNTRPRSWASSPGTGKYRALNHIPHLARERESWSLGTSQSVFLCWAFLLQSTCHSHGAFQKPALSQCPWDHAPLPAGSVQNCP